MRKFIFILLSFTLLLACNNDEKKEIDFEELTPILVKEVLQTTQYTFIRTSEDGQDHWFAAPSMDARIGTVYYYDQGKKVTNFESRELNRVFDEITLLVDIYDADSGNKQNAEEKDETHTATINNERVEISVEPALDGIPLATLIKNKKSYKNKRVKIRGMVTKFNPSIMGKNWVHIQDGTEYKGAFDLTITTQEVVNTGDIVTFEGKIALDRDFGFGYYYELLMEEGKIVE